MGPDYSQVPKDITLKIYREHLDTIPQLLAFSAVCKSWRSAVLEFDHIPNRRRRRPCLPGLFFSEARASPNRRHDGPRNCRPTHDFFPLTMIFTPHHHNPSSSLPAKLGRFTLRDFLPPAMVSDAEKRPRPRRLTLPHFSPPWHGSVIEEKHYLSSKDGWLLLIRPKPYPNPNPSPGVNLYLHNPITKSTIPLPRLPWEKIRTAVNSSSPEDDGDGEGCYVFVLLRTEYNSNPPLAWCKVEAGYDNWEFMSRDSWLFHRRVRAANYIGGKLYVVESQNLHIFYNLITSSSVEATVRSFPLSTIKSDFRFTDYYLADLQGQLLLIMADRYRFNDLPFEAYKLVLAGESMAGDELDCSRDKHHDWVEVYDLDGHAAFLGSHQAFTLAADDYDDPASNRNRIRGNHIYYVRGNECGIYNVENGEIEKFGNLKTMRSFWFSPLPRDNPEHEKEYDDVVFDEDPAAGGDAVDGDEDYYVIHHDYRFRPLYLYYSYGRYFWSDDELDDDSDSDDELDGSDYCYNYCCARSYFGVEDRIVAKNYIDHHVVLCRSSCLQRKDLLSPWSRTTPKRNWKMNVKYIEKEKKQKKVVRDKKVFYYL